MDYGFNFSKLLYIDNEFYFYDQEWEEDNVPIDFILYRAIKYFDRIKNIYQKRSYIQFWK